MGVAGEEKVQKEELEIRRDLISLPEAIVSVHKTECAGKIWEVKDIQSLKWEHKGEVTASVGL